MKDSWKPSKKTLYIIVGLCIVSLLFVWWGREKNILPSLSAQDVVSVSAEDISTKDTDKDGIPDWEEYLWGLDSNKGDSDGDGILDFDEIQAKKASIRTEYGFATSTASSTFTDSFSREFFTAFSALRQSGSLTDTNIQKISAQSLEVLTQQVLENKYTEKDLVVVDTTSDTKVEYKNSILNTGKSLQVKLIGREVELLTRAINKPRSDKLIIELQKIQKVYLALAERTIQVPVPNAIQKTHLELANTYYKLGASVGGLTQIYDDPAISVIYFSEYQRALEKLPSLMNTITSFTQ